MLSKLCLYVLLSEKFIFDKRAKFHLSVDKQSLNNSNLNYIFCPIFLTKEQKNKKADNNVLKIKVFCSSVRKIYF